MTETFLNPAPLVTLITVNFNGKAYLSDLFSSLREISYSPVEIIMVDNASTDDSVAFTRKNFPEVKIIENQENLMFARGNNEGIRAAAGDFICLINNDVKVEPDFLEPLVNAFKNNSRLAVAQPKVLSMEDKNIFEYAGAAGGYLDKYGYPFMRGRLFFSVEEDLGQYDDDSNIFWASGACFFIRKSVLKEVGFLDEAFTLHMEEIDLCWRVLLKNYKIKCISDSRVYHKGGGTLSMKNPQKLYWNFRNNIFLLFKNLSGVNLIRILFIRILLDKVAFFRELFSGRFTAAKSILRAYFWLSSNFVLLMKRRSEIQSSREVSDDKIFKLIYPGSIVYEYFFKQRKEFSRLLKVETLKKNCIENN